MAASGLLLRSRSLRKALALLFPGLRSWPVGEWPAVLRRVRQTEFDHVERFGILAALVLTVWLLKPATPPDLPAPLGFVTQLALSLPILLLLAGPFFLRRIRRTLELEGQARTKGGPDRTR